MPTNRPLRVFLCHSSNDKPTVRELYQKLRAEPWIEPWLDEEELLPGQDWGIEIEKAVETSDAVIAFLSNHSITKEGYIQKELRFVLDVADEKPEETIFVIPLRLEDCLLPRRLKRWHYLDLFPKSQRNQAYSRLLQSLKVRYESLAINVRQTKNKSLPVSSAQEKVKKQPANSTDGRLQNLAAYLDKKIDFDELWLLCEDVGKKCKKMTKQSIFLWDLLVLDVQNHILLKM